MNITIQDQVVRHGKKQMKVSEFCQVVQESTVSGMRDEPIPDNVRWIVSQGNHTVYIVELQPEVRSLIWDSTTEDDCGDITGESGLYTVSMPYVVLKIPFYQTRLAGYPELFYRNEPLKSIDDKLYHSNLMNVTSLDYAKGLICLDGLDVDGCDTHESILNELTNHLWGSEFNLQHGFDYCHFAREGDKRLHSMEAWQAATRQDPGFITSVDWVPAGVTVRDIIERHFQPFSSVQKPFTSKALGNLLLKVAS